MTRTGAVLGIQYARHLRLSERYRDLAIVSGALLQLLDREEQPEEWARLAALFGQGLRMTGKDDQSIDFFRSALEIGSETLTKSEKGGVWLGIALAEQKLDNNDAAIDAARQTKINSKQGDGFNLQADSILAQLTLKGSARAKSLAGLEVIARKSGHIVLADTIALDFAHDANTPKSKIAHLDRVLKSKDSGYNQARAITAKANAVARQPSANLLQGHDLATLLSSYSYLHGQRFSAIFDQCHAELWRTFEVKGLSDQLLRPFRHSSFIWRIRGDESKEAEYLKRLEDRKIHTAVSPEKSLVIELNYFVRRLKALINGSKEKSDDQA